jgi:hypothetical protein
VRAKSGGSVVGLPDEVVVCWSPKSEHGGVWVVVR